MPPPTTPCRTGVYVFPLNKHPSLLADDLPFSDHHRPQATEGIVRAGKEFGSFQVANHGVGEGVVRGFWEAAAGFFVTNTSTTALSCLKCSIYRNTYFFSQVQ